MAISNPGGLLNSVPAQRQQTLSTNYLDLAATANEGWAQQYVPDLMEKEADSLRDILNGNNLSHAAETLYAAHHSNAYGHTATNRVMNNALERYYG